MSHGGSAADASIRPAVIAPTPTSPASLSPLAVLSQLRTVRPAQQGTFNQADAIRATAAAVNEWVFTRSPQNHVFAHKTFVVRTQFFVFLERGHTQRVLHQEPLLRFIEHG